MHTVNENFMKVLYNVCLRSGSGAPKQTLKDNADEIYTGYLTMSFMSGSNTSSSFCGITLGTGSQGSIKYKIKDEIATSSVIYGPI